MTAQQGRYTGLLLVLCVALTGYRIWVILRLGLDPYVDEAYYWGWSQALDWGYYSKPPMIAAMIAASEAVFGHTLIALKLPALLCYPLTALVVQALGARLFSPRIGFWAAVVVLTIPLVSALGLFVSTDAPLLLFWAIALWGLARALDSGRWSNWLVVGVAFGLGMMTKYTMAAFAGSAFLAMLADPRGRRALGSARPWIAFALGVALFIPNVWWNVEHAFPTFRHTAEITRLESRSWAPGEFGEFIGAQWLSFGPLLAFGLLWVLARTPRLWRQPAYRLLLVMVWPLLLLVSVQALTGRANGNWAAPIYVAASLLVPAYLLEARRGRLFALAVGVNIAVMCLVYHWPDVHRLTGKPMSAKLDPFKRARGWSALAAQVAPHLARHPDAILMGVDRETLAQLNYQLQPKAWVSWNPEGRVMDQYELTTRLVPGEQRPILFASEGPDIAAIAARFEHVEPLGEVRVQVYPKLLRQRFLFLLQGFKGYK
ncbi:glycosyltransferase family 39 protein [Nitrogeniibacter mangrovi]|uniref:Glycosyltransferase family 39 protein n=1 Tax=Nitrogeniibacter mangrovi TaxID=2016596 RepID=A0A6C1B2K2_9RHOO|nr:glycosyltransferase family 39 protein [Nitrogeniibacter mangrovi]QID17866.1 glycosyltransferase family 39 protein [Nitrogeniibacter mangrovi]